MMAFFGLVGCVLAAFVAPRFIVWYWNPPADMGFNCVKPIEWSLHRLQLAQLVGLGAGVLFGLFLFLAFRRRREALPPASAHSED